MAHFSISFLNNNLLSACLLSMLACSATAANPMQPIENNDLKQTLPATIFQSQHDKPVSIDSNTRLVLLSTHKAGNTWVKNSFQQLNITHLNEKNWVYVADISAMPSMITKLFALPKMKKYTFTVALDKTGEATKNWQKQANTVTAYQLNQLMIEDIHHFTNEQELTDWLKIQ